MFRILHTCRSADFVRKQAQAILTETMHNLVSAVLTSGKLRFQLHYFYLHRFFVSFNRGVLRLCCRLHGRESGFCRCDAKLPVICMQLSKESALPGVFVDLSGHESRPSAALPLLTVACIAARYQTFASEVSLSLNLKCPSTSRRPSLKKFLSSPIMPRSRDLPNVRN